MPLRIKRLLWLILFALAMTASVEAQQDSPLDTIKIDTNLVVLRVAVNDQQGRAAMSLKQGAFKVYEDGVEQQIGFFSAEESPISWGLVLDRSGSMMGMMSDVYDAALHVIDEGTSRDETFIVTFNKRPELISDFTSDRHRLENSILGLSAEGETALFDAKVPASMQKYLVVDSSTYSQMRQIPRFSEYNSARDAGVRTLVDGSIGKLKDFFVFRSQFVNKTGSGPVTTNNVAFAKDAIGLVVRRLPQPLPGDSFAGRTRHRVLSEGRHTQACPLVQAARTGDDGA